jgi:hypothetical protein
MDKSETVQGDASATREVSITLSRAHKVADRLKGLVSAAAAAATSGFENAIVRGTTADQLENFQRRREDAKRALERFDELNCALLGVRSAIGRANVKAGVSDLLAHQEALKRKLSLVKSLVHAENPNEVQPEQLRDYRPLASGENAVFRSDSAVSVCFVTPEMRKHFQTVAERVQKELFALSDKLSDLNGERLVIVLPAAIAQEVGL